MVAEITRPRPVSTKPGDAIGDQHAEPSDRERLLSMPCESVVDWRVSVEIKRTAHMTDEQECETRLHASSAPKGLINALDGLAQRKARSRTLIEKCLIHQGEALMSDIPGLKELNDWHSRLVDLHNDCGGLDDILEQIKTAQYMPLSERSFGGDFYGAKRVMSKVSGYGKGLGITQTMTVSAALMLSLSTTEDDKFVGAAGEVMPEVHHFLDYVHERSTVMRAFWQIAQDRLNAQNRNHAGWRRMKGILWTREAQSRASASSNKGVIRGGKDGLFRLRREKADKAAGEAGRTPSGGWNRSAGSPEGFPYLS